MSAVVFARQTPVSRMLDSDSMPGINGTTAAFRILDAWNAVRMSLNLSWLVSLQKGSETSGLIVANSIRFQMVLSVAYLLEQAHR